MTTDTEQRRRRQIDFFHALVLDALAGLGVVDQLAEKTLTVDELAVRTGAHEPSLRRLLRAAAGLDLVRQAPDGRVHLTAAGRAPHPGEADLAVLAGDMAWRVWQRLEASIRSGRPAFDDIHGQSLFEHLNENPDKKRAFAQNMARISAAAAPGIVAACDLSTAQSIVDLGGGDGTLLSAILVANPGSRGVLYDIEDDAGAARTLRAAGVADRCRIIAGDFLEGVPQGHDTYILKNVLHNWDDHHTEAILANCRAAITPTGHLLIVETLIPEGPARLAEAPMALMSDLNMLLLTGGRQRTATEFRALLATSGFTMMSVTACPAPADPLPAEYSVVHAIPTVGPPAGDAAHPA